MAKWVVITRLFVRLRLVQWDIAGGPLRRNLPAVDLVGQIAIHYPLCPDGGAQRSIFGVGSGNAGDQPIGLAEIETRIKAEGHDGGGSSRRADPGQHSQDTLIVHAQIVKALGKGKDAVKVFAFDPILILAWSVALIGSGLKERNNHDLDGNRRRNSRKGAGSRQDANQQRQQSSAHTGA